MCHRIAGTITPLPALTHSLGDAASAFRQLSAARHIGKVVVEVPQQLPLQEQRSGRWVISGGLGALGSLTAHWLTARGERMHSCACRCFFPNTTAEFDEVLYHRCEAYHSAGPQRPLCWGF